MKTIVKRTDGEDTEYEINRYRCDILDSNIIRLHTIQEESVFVNITADNIEEVIIE